MKYFLVALLPAAAGGLQVGAAGARTVSSASEFARPRTAAVQLAENPPYDPENDPDIPQEPTLRDWIDNMPFAMSKSLARQTLLSQSKVQRS